MREQHHVLELDAAELDAFDHAIDRIGGRGRFGHVHLAGILVKDAKIGKSSADIASHSEGHFPLAFIFSVLSMSLHSPLGFPGIS